ncbi:MAG: hypothetical protein E7016_05855 [Alphaproteobacteria bacterium]|nr:hypothetical protein [Alphaproteobacteria bacterium]
MRKYFLLSAVALLATSTANATTDYAEVTAKATIQVAGTLECNGGEVDYGTIVVKQDNEEFVIDYYGESTSEDFISMSGEGNISSCAPGGSGEYLNNFTASTELTSAEGNKLSLNAYINKDSEELLTELTIPANVKAGEYTGSFTVTYTY